MGRSLRGKRLAVALAGCVVAVFAVTAGMAATGLWVRLAGPAVVANSLVGRTEPEVVREFGRPVSRQDGYGRPVGMDGNVHPGLNPPAVIPDGPVKTLTFVPHGFLHQEGGTLVAWFALRDGRWVCFESCWFADGELF